MVKKLKLGDLQVDVVFKDIKNVHLSVHPPAGMVRISAPLRMNFETIRVFAISKLGWIKSQQKKMQDQERETRREYLERESHYVWGKRYLLVVEEVNQPPGIEAKQNRLIMRVRPGTNEDKRQSIAEEWYRGQVRQAVPAILSKWEPLIGVKVGRFFVQRMKTKWGSCNHRTGSIRLNTELAKKLPECLEYIVVHEMIHLLEPTHNARFISLMDHFMPKWKFYREKLNRYPVSHEHWKY